MFQSNYKTTLGEVTWNKKKKGFFFFKPYYPRCRIVVSSNSCAGQVASYKTCGYFPSPKIYHYSVCNQPTHPSREESSVKLGRDIPFGNIIYNKTTSTTAYPKYWAVPDIWHVGNIPIECKTVLSFMSPSYNWPKFRITAYSASANCRMIPCPAPRCLAHQFVLLSFKSGWLLLVSTLSHK